MEIINKNVPIFGEIIRQKTIMIWCLILYNPIMARNVFQGAFLRLSLRHLPRKSQGSEQYAQIAISPGHFHHGKVVARQV